MHMASGRLLSLDIFRGMTIFFMILVNTPGSWNFVYAPLLHAKWDGCTPTDLVFPFFMFISGVSMAISYAKYTGSRIGWINKVVYRGLAIILIGLLLNWFPFYHKHISELRVFGVLQRIGLSVLLVGVLIAFSGMRSLMVVTVAILIGYWALMLGGGDLSLEGNLIRKLDLALVGEKHIYYGFGIPFDPEGLLSTLPACCTMMIGYLTGMMLLKTSGNPGKVKWLLIAGMVLTAAGYIWSILGFPLNKALWSSSYVLYSAGLAMLFLSLMIWLIDIRHVTGWSYIFKSFGQNPLASFVLSILLVKISLHIKPGEMNLYEAVFEKGFRPFFGDYPGSLMFALTFVLFVWLFAWWMDRRGIVIKV